MSRQLTEIGDEEQRRESSLDADTVRMVIEAILFAATDPVSDEQLFGLFGRKVSEDEIRNALSSLWEGYEKASSSLQIVKIGGGFKLTTRAQYAPWIEKFFTRRREVSLTKASLEVLSIIAYQQPVTISQIDYVRGVDSSGVVKGLLGHGLVTVKGRKKAPGRPLLLATTDKFLDHFGLSDLDSLPRPDEFVGAAHEAPFHQEEV